MTLNATKKPPVKANGGWSQAKIDIYWFGRILWACRISAASAFGGLALFWGVVQAQNLFADRSFDELFFGAHYWLPRFSLRNAAFPMAANASIRTARPARKRRATPAPAPRRAERTFRACATARTFFCPPPP